MRPVLWTAIWQAPKPLAVPSQQTLAPALVQLNSSGISTRLKTGIWRLVWDGFGMNEKDVDPRTAWQEPEASIKAVQ